MLEEIIEKEKRNIDKRSIVEKIKVDFIRRICNRKKKVLKNYMNEHKISERQIYDELLQIISNFNNLYIEKNNKIFQLKEINELLPVRLGYYKRLASEFSGVSDLSDPEEYCQQCVLTLTDEGIKTMKEYNRLLR